MNPSAWAEHGMDDSHVPPRGDNLKHRRLLDTVLDRPPVIRRQLYISAQIKHHHPHAAGDKSVAFRDDASVVANSWHS